MTPRIPTLVLSAFFLLFSVFAVSIPAFADSSPAHHKSHSKKHYFLAPDITVSGTSVNSIDVANGKLNATDTDLTSNTLSFSRVYSAMGLTVPTLGGWNHNYSSRLLVNGLSYDDWRGIKSDRYKKKKTACVTGWNDIKASLFNGQLAGAKAKFHHGLCSISLNGKKMAEFMIHAVNHNNNKTVTLSQPDGSSISFVKHGKNGNLFRGHHLPYLVQVKTGKSLHQATI